MDTNIMICTLLVEIRRSLFRIFMRIQGSKPWMRYAGMVQSGDPASSQKIDQIIYGQESNG